MPHALHPPSTSTPCALLAFAPCAVGRWDLHHAIVALGGYLEVASALSRKPASSSREAMIKTFDELREELLAFMEQQQEEAEGEDQGQGRQGGEQQGGVQGGVVQVTPEAEDRELSMQREQGGGRGLQPQASEEPMEGDTRRDGAGVASSSVRSSIGHAQDGGARSGRAGSAAAEPKRMPTERQLVAAGRTDIVSVSQAAVGGGVWPVMGCKWHVLPCCQMLSDKKTHPCT